MDCGCFERIDLHLRPISSSENDNENSGSFASIQKDLVNARKKKDKNKMKESVKQQSHDDHS